MTVELCATGHQLFVRYRVVGTIADLRVPSPTQTLDPHRLWAHTCGELFGAQAGKDAYTEWNFSPTGQSTRFEFSAYRQRTSSHQGGAEISVGSQTDHLWIEARTPVPHGPSQTLDVAPTMVIEDADGTLSFWALAHRGDLPDFHRRDGFVLPLTVGQ